MQEKKNKCTLSLSKVPNSEEIVTWLENVHKLDACVGDYEHSNGSITQYLVVQW